MKKRAVKKHLAILVILILITTLASGSVYAEQKAQESPVVDSVQISDEIVQQLEVEETDQVYRIYNVPIGKAFSTVQTIDEVLERSDLMRQMIYLVISEDGSYQQKVLAENEVGIMDVGLPVSSKCIDAMVQDAVIKRVSPDIEVYGRYYLTEPYARKGYAVYYQTDQGDYVYYFHLKLADMELLFPAAVFCQYQSAVMKRMKQWSEEQTEDQWGMYYPVDEVWVTTLPKFNIHSPDFDLNASIPKETVTPALSSQKTDIPPSSTASSSQAPDTGLVIGVAVGAVVLVAAAVGFAVARKRKAKG